MKREEFKNYDDYIYELLKLCKQYHMKEKKNTRNKLIIADNVFKHDVQTQRAVENCEIKSPNDLVDFLKIIQGRDELPECNEGKIKVIKDTSNSKKESIVCYICQEKGHYANECNMKGNSLNKLNRVYEERKVQIVKENQMKGYSCCPRKEIKKSKNGEKMCIVLGLIDSGSTITNISKNEA
uniref:CCHC-type domain-containing protein n=1 Tax=Strongyloides venezuelensis TaxID=75913 RepID=A0A0K0FWF5_STRVS